MIKKKYIQIIIVTCLDRPCGLLFASRQIKAGAAGDDGINTIG